MFFVYTLLAFAVVVAAIFIAPLKAKAWTTLAVVVAGAVAATAMAVNVLASGTTIELWSLSGGMFGNDSGRMDSLSALFVAVISIGSVASVLYARGYLEHTLGEKSTAHVSLHYASLAVMAYAMMGVVTSEGGYSFLFFWELMTVASFLLILYDAQRREVVRAALSYLIMMHMGFVMLVIGFVMLSSATGSASFTALARYFATENALPLMLVFIAGFGMKAGMFPLHVWLPEAHPAAPSHVSALMSGVMIKTGIYGIMRVVAALGDAPLLHTAGYIILGVGVVTGLWGVILAALQNDVKRLMAYSSIENIGVILIGFGIAILGKASGNGMIALCGITGALLHTVNHSFFKSLLFFGAGNVLSQTHTTSLDALGGLGKYMPVTGLLFLCATAAICALPPLNGFVSELLIYMGMLEGIASGSDVLTSAAALTALALIGGLVVMAFTKLYGIIFLGAPRTHEVAEAQEVDNFRIVAMAVPLAGIAFVGLFPQVAVSIVVRAAGFFVEMPAEIGTNLLSPALVTVTRAAWLLVAVVALVAWLRHRALKGRNVRSGATWGCGFTAPNVKMQYTGESFTEGLQAVATSLAANNVEGSPVGKGEIFPASHEFAAQHGDRIGGLFAAWWVELLRIVNKRVMRLRTGKINNYVLFALAFLAFVFILSILNLM